MRHQEQARQQEKAHREAEAGLREEEDRRRRQTDPAEEVFEPYSVLGVARDATQEDIRAAYQEARLKYNADNVTHLGAELQEHFKVKAQAVERAYQQLTR